MVVIGERIKRFVDVVGGKISEWRKYRRDKCEHHDVKARVNSFWVIIMCYECDNGYGGCRVCVDKARIDYDDCSKAAPNIDIDCHLGMCFVKETIKDKDFAEKLVRAMNETGIQRVGWPDERKKKWEIIWAPDKEKECREVERCFEECMKECRERGEDEAWCREDSCIPRCGNPEACWSWVYDDSDEEDDWDDEEWWEIEEDEW